jgi:hypothetical protein
MASKNLPPPLGRLTQFVTRVMPIALGGAALQIAYTAYTNPMTEEERLALVERRDPNGRRRELAASLARRRDADLAAFEAEKANTQERALSDVKSRQSGDLAPANATPTTSG